MSHRALLFAPFPLDHEHHGARRMARFADWLAQDAWQIMTVSSSGEAFCCQAKHAVVVDPFGVWEREKGRATAAPRRSLAVMAGGRGLGRNLVPDQSIGWSLRTLVSRQVHRLVRETTVVVSSSPPESPHIAASLLAGLHGKPHVVDMRDGWMDEPLKTELLTQPLRAAIERRMERWVLRRAAYTLVTSPEWRDALIRRQPELGQRVRVVRNSIQDSGIFQTRKARVAETRWVYAGRLQGSRASQDAALLLRVLHAEAKTTRYPIEFRFVGALNESEIALLSRFSEAIRDTGCSVTQTGHVTHASAIAEIASADALLLLCCSEHALPSKLFEYVAAAKPILAVCRRDSATWNACQKIAQAMRLAIDHAAPSGEFGRFIESGPAPAVDRELSVQVAHAELLQTFEQCRRPVCRANVARPGCHRVDEPVT